MEIQHVLGIYYRKKIYVQYLHNMAEVILN